MDVWQDTLQRLISLPKIDEASIQIPVYVDVVSIVESLQPFMTHSDPLVRGKAATVFKVAVNQKFEGLDNDSLSLLKSFITQKVDDAAVVIESLAILGLFYQRKALNDSEMLSVCIRALKGIKAFRFGVENRNVIFNFVQSYLKNISQLPESDAELFYESVLNAMESEKDPRNLMLVFDTISCIISKFQMGEEYVEELFESCFCYFPITFRSNPSDPTLITVDELKASLRRAITGDKRFGDFAVPLLIEKLSTNSTSAAKIDSLDVLLDSASVYDASSFLKYRFELEVAIFSEIVANSDSKIQSKSFQLVKLLSSRFSGEEWMNKFLREAVKAVEMEENQAIMSKAPLLIEAVANSSENCFKYALDTCAVPLIQKSTQLALNSLVALFSSLKSNPQWSSSINQEIRSALTVMFSSINCELESYAVYLIIYAFTNPILSQNDFMTKFLLKCSGYPMISNELKNCIWVASKNLTLTADFCDIFGKLESQEIISAFASTSELTKIAILRLIELDAINAIDQVILNSLDLSLVVNDFELLWKLFNLPINQNSIVKLFSKCDSASQVRLINEKCKLETILISARPEVILECKKVIMEELPSFSNPYTITSLFNKCPDTFLMNFDQKPELFLAAIKGLIYRMDPRALDLLKANIEKFPITFYAKMFKAEDEKSCETFHIKKALHLQWTLTFILQEISTQSSNNLHSSWLALLISLVSVAPSSLINLNSEILSKLILQLLNDEEACKEIDLEIIKSAWNVLLEHFECVQVDELIDLALKQASKEQSAIRYFAMKLLSKLVENNSTRSKILASSTDWQKMVISTIKTLTNDPKRAVRQEAARAINLWIVFKEEGVLQ